MPSARLCLDHGVYPGTVFLVTGTAGCGQWSEKRFMDKKEEFYSEIVVWRIPD